LEFGTINPNLVECYKVGECFYYRLKNQNEKRFLIVQAYNPKKASAKMLTLISREEHGNN
jgi:hypothetical protein